MGYKDILVYVDNTKDAAVRLDTAARLALSQGAHLTALHIDQAPYMPVELIGTGMAAQVRQWQKTVQKEKIDKIQAIVHEVSERHGLSVEWRQQEGALDEGLLSQSAYADLIVVSQPGDPLDLEQPIAPSPGGLALSSARPILVIPSRAGDYPVGKNILIAWKACPESARAVHDALPLLKMAQSVTILEVNPEVGPGRDRLVGAEIAQHLARHGVKISVVAANEKSASEGATILARASEIGADMIVMGAYGHSRLREAVLGGVTHHLLKHHHIPIFMAH